MDGLDQVPWSLTENAATSHRFFSEGILPAYYPASADLSAREVSIIRYLQDMGEPIALDASIRVLYSVQAVTGSQWRELLQFTLFEVHIALRAMFT